MDISISSSSERVPVSFSLRSSRHTPPRLSIRLATRSESGSIELPESDSAKPRALCNSLRLKPLATSVDRPGPYFGRSYLLLAAAADDTNLMHALIARGADPAELSAHDQRWNALLSAAYCLRLDAVQSLIDQHDMEVNACNAHGWTALKMVLERDAASLDEDQLDARRQIIGFLLQRGANPLQECAHDESFAELRAYGMDPLQWIDVPDAELNLEASYRSNGCSPLEVAVRNKDRDALEAFVRARPDWAPAVDGAPFFRVLETVWPTRSGAIATYLEFREALLMRQDADHPLDGIN